MLVGCPEARLLLTGKLSGRINKLVLRTCFELLLDLSESSPLSTRFLTLAGRGNTTSIVRLASADSAAAAADEEDDA
mgnify:CR=1 FL=1